MLIRLGLVLLSVALTYLSFPNVLFIEGFPGVAWGALVPFLAALDARPLRERFLFGCLWGILTFALLTRWMLDVSAGGFVLFALALSLAPIVFSLFAVAPFQSSFVQLFWWPCIWVLSEWLRTFILGGFTWSLAYSQAAAPSLIQAASFGGVFVVVWILVLVNSAIGLAIKARGRYRKFFLTAASFIFLANWIVGGLRQNSYNSDASMRMALIQPNISRSDKMDVLCYDRNISRHMALTKKATFPNLPELIVWPETAFPDDILSDLKWRPEMESLARNYQANFLIGSALEKGGHSRNAALLISPQGEWVDAYYKMKLVPFTEYLPSDAVSHWLADILHIKPYDFVAGKGLGIFSIERRLPRSDRRVCRFGVVICSEEAYPEFFRQLVRRQVDFVVIMLNDGWFNHKEALLMHSQNAAFRAVESGTSVVRVANTGRTLAFDWKGQLVDVDVPMLQAPGFVVINLPLFRQHTLYSSLGDIFAWFCLGFVIINLGCVFLKKRLQAFH